jgi:hypothetical protein
MRTVLFGRGGRGAGERPALAHQKARLSNLPVGGEAGCRLLILHVEMYTMSPVLRCGTLLSTWGCCMHADVMYQARTGSLQFVP